VVKFHSPAASIPASTPGVVGHSSAPTNTAIKARLSTAPAAENPANASIRRKSARVLGSSLRASGNVTTSFQTKLLKMASATPTSAAAGSGQCRVAYSQSRAT